MRKSKIRLPNVTPNNRINISTEHGENYKIYRDVSCKPKNNVIYDSKTLNTRRSFSKNY